ncbi:hypothetical protein [Streptomyces sp. NPDC000880]
MNDRRRRFARHRARRARCPQNGAEIAGQAHEDGELGHGSQGPGYGPLP